MIPQAASGVFNSQAVSTLHRDASQSDVSSSDGLQDIEEFCVNISDTLVGVLTVRLGNRFLAEEIAQEALVKAMLRWDTIGKMENPKGYVFRTALHIASSHFRRFKAERRAVARAQQEPPRQLQSSTVKEFRRLVCQLSKRQQEVMILRYYADLTVEQTADTLGVSPGTVKKLSSRALSRLKIELGAELENEEHE